MTDQPITYKSADIELLDTSTVLETNTNNGVKCVWKGRGNTEEDDLYGTYFNGLTLSWDFDWSDLKARGVDRLSGHITVRSFYDWFDTTVFDVDMTESVQKIERTISTYKFYDLPYVTFEYSLTPHRSPIEAVCYDEMFLSSERTDAILVIDGKKLHVNKAFLSFHSDFFRALFSSNFKEGQMDEIPINDVSYEDFGLLMSTIYPKTQYPSDRTVEKLLELADRFMIPAVMGHVEYHLLNNARITNEKMLWMADAYGMPNLFGKCLRELDTVEKARKLKASPEYKKLSKDARCSVLDRVMEFI